MTIKEMLKIVNETKNRKLDENEKRYAENLFGNLQNIATEYKEKYGSELNSYAFIKDVKLHVLAEKLNIKLPKSWNDVPVMAIATSLNDDCNMAYAQGCYGSAMRLEKERTEFYDKHGLDKTNIRNLSLNEKVENINENIL